MAGAGKQAPTYKRSWKNLLINKRYQLRFTLFMVGVSLVLMTALGWWVMREANEATTVAKIRVRGEPCPKVPEVVEAPQEEMGMMGADPAAPMNVDEPPKPAADAPPEPAPAPEQDPPPPDKAAEAAPPTESDLVAVKALWCLDAECNPELATPMMVKANKCDDYVKGKFEDAESVDALKTAKIPVVKCEGGESHSVADANPRPRRAAVQLEESSMTIALPTDFADRIVSHHICEMRQAGQLDALEDGRARILYVLIATGLLLTIGLAIYGIKMTHKVAGPLFKVTLYLAKMRDGRYDKVWNLRKGDQLVDFYEHFKSAHAGVVTMEKADIEQLKATIAAAKDAGLGDHETTKELETMLARKEKSLE
jgi:hypothetical protein